MDANVVVGGICWRGESHLCLIKLAQRRYTAHASEWILNEIRETANELVADGKHKFSPWTTLSWYLQKVKMVEAAPLGKQRSRDAKDDPYLAAALSAKAVIVTYDKDLLDMGKPFGIEIMKPATFLSRLP